MPFSIREQHKVPMRDSSTPEEKARNKGGVVSTDLRGRSDTRDENGNVESLVGFRVAVLGARPLLRGGNSFQVSEAAGHFDLHYQKDGSKVGSHRILEFEVQDVAGRVLPI